MNASAVSTATDFPRHLPFQRPLVRIAVAAMALAIVVAAARQGSSQATQQPAPSDPVSILPANIGTGLQTDRPVHVDFAQPMDTASVAQSLLISPEITTSLSWSHDARHLAIAPTQRWEPDERYVVILPSSSQLANGSVLGAALRYSFTTRAAPTVIEFSVHRRGLDRLTRLSLDRAIPDEKTSTAVAPAAPATPADTAQGASATTTISIRFSSAMNRAEVGHSFLISPAAAGSLSWLGSTLTFTPSRRLDPGARYSIALVGVHDMQGDRLAGDTAFSFTIASRAHVTKVSPANGAKGVAPRAVEVSFSDAVDAETTGSAFRLFDVNAKAPVAGSLGWNPNRTKLGFSPRAALAPGHRFEIRIGGDARDVDGNVVSGTYSFVTRAAERATTARPAYRAPSPSGSVQAYALALINTSRRAFGFAPLTLDSRLTAVASAHAWDQIRYGYFSHLSRDGSTFRQRISAAGISWSHAGENQCLDYGSITHALSWCHSIMMAEPYPGVWNHIANILDPNFTRVGFGYGIGSDGKLVMTWDFIG
jgi:uncharacterized protein YkwD